MLGGIGLDLVTTIPAPHDQADGGRGSAAERHRWAGFGLHPRSFWAYLRANSLFG
jgi:hypothetical protein